MADIIRYAMISALLGFLFAILYYAEPYLFLVYPISESGGLKTVNMIPNNISAFILSISFIFSGFCFLKVFFIIRKEQPEYSWLSLLISIGFFLTAIPTDSFHIIHAIGGNLLFISLWLFFIRLFFKKKVEDFVKYFLHYPFLLVIPIYLLSFLFPTIYFNVVFEKLLMFLMVFLGLFIKKII